MVFAPMPCPKHTPPGKQSGACAVLTLGAVRLMRSSMHRAPQLALCLSAFTSN